MTRNKDGHLRGVHNVTQLLNSLVCSGFPWDGWFPVPGCVLICPVTSSPEQSGNPQCPSQAPPGASQPSHSLRSTCVTPTEASQSEISDRASLRSWGTSLSWAPSPRNSQEGRAVEMGPPHPMVICLLPQEEALSWNQFSSGRGARSPDPCGGGSCVPSAH